MKKLSIILCLIAGNIVAQVYQGYNGVQYYPINSATNGSGDGGGIQNPLTSDLNANGFAVNNANNVVVTNTGVGFPQTIYQIPYFFNGISLPENSGVSLSNRIQFPHGDIVEKLHTQDVYEFVMTSAGGIALVEGQDAQSNGVIQIGATGAYHCPIWINADSVGLTNLAGWSHVVLFGDTINGSNRDWGIQLQAETTNAPYNNKLVFFDVWAGGNAAGGNTGFSGGQLDSLGLNHIAGYMDSNAIYWNGINLTNGLVVTNGKVTLGTNIDQGFRLSFVDNTDSQSTGPILTYNGIWSWSPNSGNSALSEQMFWRDRGGATQLEMDGGNQLLRLFSGMSLVVNNNKNTATAPLDVSGAGVIQSLTVSNGLTVSNLTTLTETVSNNFFGNTVAAMSLISSNAASIPINNVAFAVLNNPLIDMVTPFVNGAYRATLSVTVALTDSAVTGSPGALLTNTSSLQGIPITNSFVLSGTQYQTVTMRLSPNDQVYVTNLSSGSASTSLVRSFLTKE